jgi:predicted TIM-barrel fold metal-dependent hydrolase
LSFSFALQVHFHQGLEMLKIFKFFPTRTSLLDDFAFYDSRQKVLQERKSKQQQRLQVLKSAPKVVAKYSIVDVSGD